MGGLGKLMIVPQEMSLGQFVPLNTTSLPGMLSMMGFFDVGHVSFAENFNAWVKQGIASSKHHT